MFNFNLFDTDSEDDEEEENIDSLSRMSTVLDLVYNSGLLGIANNPMDDYVWDVGSVKRAGVIQCYLNDCVDVLKHQVLRLPKNDTTALRHKNQGNEFFRRRNYESALKKYNEAICFAPKDSENLAICFANRSAVYFDLQHYDECL